MINNNILITGATGNVGRFIIDELVNMETECNIYAGVRNIKKAENVLGNNLNYRYFDLEDSNSFEKALDGINIIFLLRPPHISNIEAYIKPLINKAKSKEINKIVFLSVQDADKLSFIPHSKIEKLILEYGMEYIFIRPSYFMQNLTSTLIDDIKQKNKIFLPAGKAKFNWIDTKNIAEVAAIFLNNFDKYKNKAFTITGDENLDFYETAEIINDNTALNIDYDAANPIRFLIVKLREGVPFSKILVMMFLHILQRFNKEPEKSHDFKNITGKKPNKLVDFIEREQKYFNSN